jgi:SAM-dependent methyltransferase
VADLSASTPEVDRRDDAHSLPAAWTERFALVLCNAVLEHVPYPQRAVDDFCRVLAPGGYLYLEVAFWQPYPAGRDPDAGGETRFYEDYWRATVEGLRVWAEALDEISCGWADEGVAYYFGVKPGI